MPLQATSGAASYDAFGGGVAAVPNYIEECFSAFLYTGNGSTQTITNGIDLAGKGGLVWRQGRSAATGGMLIDTARGIGSYLISYSTDAAQTGSNWIDSFNSNGFTMNSSSFNGGATYASWTFRKQPKFFDVVTYTGNDTAGRTVSHNLGAVPGCIIVKCSSADGDNWIVYHQSLGATQGLFLNSTGSAITSANLWNNTAPTDTVFSVGGTAGVNGAGRTYVAYLFAHNAGGFGLTGTDNVISCGSYTGTGSTLSVTLGYEPQWVMIKRTDTTADWQVIDNMRGWTADGVCQRLVPNTSAAEAGPTGSTFLFPTATGFGSAGSSAIVNASGGTYIYIAIRRGPMKVPTSGTSVFNSITRTGTGATANITGAGFPPDMIWNRNRGSGYETDVNDKLRGAKLSLFTPYTQAETDLGGTGMTTIGQDGCTVATDTSFNQSGGSFVLNFWRRAPSFFDEVCYTGTGSTTTFNHNLGVAPELMIIKSRSDALGWRVYAAPAGNTGYLVLNANDAFGTSSATWNNTSPTSSVFTVGTTGAVNSSGSTFVAYLFASVSGVSKVGSYTGTGATQTINCGFTGGARFVMVKRTDNLGSWWVWDTARGMVSGTDPRLELNTTNAETNANWVYTTSTGFQVVSTNSEVNASGGTYIYLAIA